MFPFSAAASMKCTIGIAIVRQIIVKNNPATESGIATAIDVEIAVCTSVLPPSNPNTMMIADATDASAASGATAAPTFAHPSAIICSEPPRMIPSDACPLTTPIKVHATSG